MINKWTKVTLAAAAAAGIVSGGIGVASATPTGAGTDCQVFDDPMTCYTGGDGYQGSGLPPTIGSVGRTFVTDTDVTWMTATQYSLNYDPVQWDSWSDFINAAYSYWNINKPVSGCWISVTSPRSPGSCRSYYASTGLNPDGTQSVTIEPSK